MWDSPWGLLLGRSVNPFYLWIRIVGVERLLLQGYRRGNRMHVANLVELVYMLEVSGILSFFVFVFLPPAKLAIPGI